MTKKQLSLEDENRNIRAVSLTPVAAAVMTALFPASAVLAQEQGADEEIEEIVTTGSRIRKDTFSSAAPMDVVLTEEAAVRGINDVATMLQTTTVAAGSPQVTAASSAIFVENGGLGTSTISMRGLGANRTLVLLNGRRAGPSGVQGSVSAFDLNAIPVLKQKTHLPVIVDPSHGTGHRDLVPTMSRAALAAGADGLLVEVHCHPEHAQCDGSQSLFPEDFKQMMKELRKVAEAVGRTLPHPE